MIDGLKLQINI